MFFSAPSSCYPNLHRSELSPFANIPRGQILVEFACAKKHFLRTESGGKLESFFNRISIGNTIGLTLKLVAEETSHAEISSLKEVISMKACSKDSTRETSQDSIGPYGLDESNPIAIACFNSSLLKMADKAQQQHQVRQKKNPKVNSRDKIYTYLDCTHSRAESLDQRPYRDQMYLGRLFHQTSWSHSHLWKQGTHSRHKGLG